MSLYKILIAIPVGTFAAAAIAATGNTESQTGFTPNNLAPNTSEALSPTYGTSTDLTADQNSEEFRATKDNVSIVQAALNDKGGYNLDTDGVLGKRTQSAIKDFQMQNGIAATGVLNNNTLTLLEVDDLQMGADVWPDSEEVESPDMNDDQSMREKSSSEHNVSDYNRPGTTTPNSEY